MDFEFLHRVEEEAAHLLPEVAGGFVGYMLHEVKHGFFRKLTRAARFVRRIV